MGDIIRSVAVLGLIVAALYIVGQAFTRTPENPVRPVDFAPIAQSARQVAAYPLYTPAELPKDWYANGARFEPGDEQIWHLGVLTDQTRYIGLEQARLPVDEMIKRFSEGSKRDGSLDIDGTSWQRWTGPGDRLTLVREVTGGTVLITTTSAPLGDVRRYVASLVDG